MNSRADAADSVTQLAWLHVMKRRRCWLGHGWNVILRFPRVNWFTSFTRLCKLMLFTSRALQRDGVAHGCGQDDSFGLMLDRSHLAAGQSAYKDASHANTFYSSVDD